jgi:zinc transport system substrate-binding protein
MIKNIKRLFITGLCLITLTGCVFKSDTMEDIDIYTTIYPIKYLINYLYGEYSTINEIYPNGVNIDEYELSNRKITEYSKSDLFVFNSLDIDRDYAVQIINKNENIKLIDVSLGMTYNYSIEELWLNPYNYLMMAQNVKNGLLEYVTNPYLISNKDNTGIEDKYEQLKYDLSRLDATLKESINNANYTTIIADNDLFKYLEKYNLNVISLDESKDLSNTTIEEAKKLITDKKVKYIYSLDTETNSTVQKLIDDYNLELITINSMRSTDGGINNSNESYITVMNNNIDLIKKELYK